MKNSPVAAGEFLQQTIKPDKPIIAMGERKVKLEDQPNEMDLDKAQKTQRDYVCSRCWGYLHVIKLRKDVFTAKCPKGHDAGYVSKSYVERQRSNNHGEYVEAVVNLGPIFGEPKPSEEELLRQLGF